MVQANDSSSSHPLFYYTVSYTKVKQTMKKFLLLVVPAIATSSSDGTFQQSEITNVLDHQHASTSSNGSMANHHTACLALASFSLENFDFMMHRNGEPEACGVAASSHAAWEKVLRDASLCDKQQVDKFELEAVMTSLLMNILDTSSCGSTDDATALPGLPGFCDMGPNRTVVQEDHEQLVRTTYTQSLPCRFYTREGLRITSLEQLQQAATTVNQNECALVTDSDTHTCSVAATSTNTTIHVYAVPAGRVFMFAPAKVGEEFHITHAGAPDAAPIVLETLSISPRVFEIHNFFNLSEADELIEKALSETSDTMGLHRSTTGSINATINSKRTSENAWDQHGVTAMRLKRRCMETLGFDEYQEHLTDGLQVLRYKHLQSYNSHPDYLSDAPNHWYNYDSGGVGANRFATVLLYMSDVAENDGGATMFTNAWPHDAPPEVTSLTHKQELDLFRSTDDAPLFTPGSWEEALAAMCQRRFSVKPKKGKAVLFYSQFSNGKEDKSAIHAACPVMRESIKWAANLWVWSGPRAESKVAPRKWPPSEDELEAAKPKQLQAYFYNSKNDPAMANAELFWTESSFWSKLGPGESAGVNTYKGHECKSP
ncbi:hypothetical protein MPSEU_000487600 [Mayamaea pseudoterrestris]|nr:hypothetical protein MPSEU_000487600 [Mayamaea pseudoterrestris]